MKGWVRRLARYAIPQWHGLAVVGSLMVAGVALDALKPWPMKLLVDSVLQGKPLPAGSAWISRLPGAGSQTGLVAWTSGATVCLFLLATAALLAQKYVLSGATTRMAYRLSRDVFDHAQHLSLRYHRSHQVGDLTRRTTDDCDCVKSLVANVALPIVTALLSLGVMFTVMYRLDSQLAIVAMVVAVPLGVLMKVFSGPMTNRTHRQYELEGQLMALAEQTLSAVPVVQAFTREEYEATRFRALSERTVRAFLGATLSQLQFRVATGAVTVLGTAGIIALGGSHVLSGRTTLGSLLVFLSYLASLYAPLETLTYVSTEYAAAAAGARRVFAVLDEVADVGEPQLGQPLRNPRGHVVLDHVTYGYQQGTPVVEDVCIEARPGETVALVGRTGAGKSTIVSLVARLADPWTGRVTIDGADIRSVGLASLRANVAHVLQEPYLLPITVAENIAYGRPDAPRAEVRAAATAAGAHDFIEALPDGYDTVLDERGATLSGGERQRIAIARALLKDAPILILDEPTAALDAETEAAVVDALRVLTAQRTTFVVAHRLSTIQSADRVVVIDGGRVVETGTPTEVLASGGIYAEMHAVQYATTDAEPAAQTTPAPFMAAPETGRRLRVALVSQEYPPETAHGGIASQAYAKAQGLSRRGHDVVVITASRSGSQTDRREEGIRVIRLAGLGDAVPLDTEPAAWLAHSLEVEAALRGLHAAKPFDLVEFAEYGAEGYFHAINSQPWQHIPTLVHLHGPLIMLAHTIGWPERDSELYRVGTFMEEQCVRLADGVYSSSDCSADWCAREYHLRREEIPRLHLGVDTEHFRPRQVERDDRPTIVFAGRIARSKGVDTLVEAACLVARHVDGLRLLLLGRDDDGLGPKLVRRAAAAGFPKLVELSGFVGHDDLPSALSSADVFAAPSRYEGGPGLVYLEAMACGLPVVACSGSGAAEVVIPDENGILVPPGDIDALATSLETLLVDRERRSQLARSARAWAVAHADREACLDRLEKLYFAVANGERLSR